jgi:hypothetical protein
MSNAFGNVIYFEMNGDFHQIVRIGFNAAHTHCKYLKKSTKKIDDFFGKDLEISYLFYS